MEEFYIKPYPFYQPIKFNIQRLITYVQYYAMKAKNQIQQTNKW